MLAQEQNLFEIGEWTVDSLAHTLTHQTNEHQVPAKAMAVLVVLALSHGRLVTRQELIDEVWNGNNYVGDKALSNAIWRIRQVFGHDAEAGEFIKTTPKTGYQLVPSPRFLATGADAPPADNRSNRITRYLLLVAAGLSLAAATAFLMRKEPVNRPASQALTVVTQLPGRELYAAPSPDGTKLAFMHVGNSGSRGVYIQSLVSPESPPERLSSSDASIFPPAWAPDSRHLAYIRVDSGEDNCEVIVRDIEGNEEYPIDQCVDVEQRTLGWSPDGSWLVYRKDDPDSGPGLYLTSMDTDFRPTEGINSRRISCTDCLLIDQEVSWSPDSRYLAVTRSKNRMSENIHRFDLADWEFTKLTHGESSIEGHAWNETGEQLLYVSEKHSLNRRIWVVDLTTKEKRELGYEGAGFPVYMPNYESILFYRRRETTYIAAIELDPESAVATFPSDIIQTSGSERNPSYSSEARKLTYYSNVSGYNEIWIADVDGTNRRQVTDLRTDAIDPTWSPDGTKIAFVALDPHNETTAIKFLEVETGIVGSITTGFGDHGAPTWASDGLSLIVPIWHGNDVDLWRIAVDGNQLTRLTTSGVSFGRESQDGTHLYFTKEDQRGLFRRSLENDAEAKVIEDRLTSGIGNWTWSDPDSILYSRRMLGNSEIVSYNLVTGEQEVLFSDPSRIIHAYGMLSFSEEHRLMFFTHREPQQIDILMAPDPLASSNNMP